MESGLWPRVRVSWLKGQCIHITVIVPRDDDAIAHAFPTKMLNSIDSYKSPVFEKLKEQTN